MQVVFQLFVGHKVHFRFVPDTSVRKILKGCHSAVAGQLACITKLCKALSKFFCNGMNDGDDISKHRIVVVLPPGGIEVRLLWQVDKSDICGGTACIGAWHNGYAQAFGDQAQNHTAKIRFNVHIWFEVVGTKKLPEAGNVVCLVMQS